MNEFNTIGRPSSFAQQACRNECKAFIFIIIFLILTNNRDVDSLNLAHLKVKNLFLYLVDFLKLLKIVLVIILVIKSSLILELI